MINQNLTRIKVVYEAFKEMAEHVVFIGGAVTSLYIDRLGSEIRPTDDVDVVIEVANYGDYSKLEEALRKKGFENDIESGVICRYKVKGVIVDIMPTSQQVLGFANQWYSVGYVTSILVPLVDDIKIRLFDPVYFIAAKLEAYNNRGGGDPRMSHDFEDIIFLLNNRTAIWDELANAPTSVREWIIQAFQNIFSHSEIYESIGAHLEYNERERLDFIVNGLNQLFQD